MASRRKERWWLLNVSIGCLLLAVLLSTSNAGSTPPRCPTTNLENATLLPNPYNCSNYYMCDNGVAIERPCPEGLYFNPIKLVCDRPEEVRCDAVALFPVAFSCPNSTDISYYRDPFSCNGFYVCDGLHDVGSHFQCPLELVFNPSLSICDYPENVDCSWPL